MTADPAARSTAILALVGAAVCWGLSFPLMKGLSAAQAEMIPGLSSWFISSWCLALRFLAAALMVAAWCAWRGTLRGWTRAEVSQAVGLGIFTGAGMLLQMDGLSYTAASTSAFITQGYCVFLPLFLALRDRRRPAWPVTAGCLLVLLGVGVLAEVDVRDISLGRGELETLGASLVFTAQILWVERPAYVDNHMGRVSGLSFLVTGLLYLPVVAMTAPSAAALVDVYAGWPALVCLVVLTLVSTLAGMVLMFTYQRGIGAVPAAIIYSSEPLFASGFSFVLPGVLSLWFGIAYANEQLTSNLLIGGALVLAANLIVQIRRRPPAG
jgi:drug/metabolite transporter (DMT)-like permease